MTEDMFFLMMAVVCGFFMLIVNHMSSNERLWGVITALLLMAGMGCLIASCVMQQARHNAEHPPIVGKP